MPSRKKNKGKERKAKKAELEAEKAKLEAERIEREMGTIRKKCYGWARGDGQLIQCNHGCDVMTPDEDDHPVTNFIDGLLMYDAKNSNNMHVGFVGFYLRDTFTTYQEVWDNERYREMAVNIFTAVEQIYCYETSVRIASFFILPIPLWFL